MFKCLENISQSDKETLPKGHKFAKDFYKNTVKVSYSCMRNIKSIIAAHNKAILNPKSNVNHGCKCRVKENCPLDNKCLTPSVVCEATVKTYSNDEKCVILISRMGLLNKDTPIKVETLNTEKYEKNTE